MAPRRMATYYYLFCPRYLTTRLSGYIATRLHDYANTLERKKPFAFAGRRFLYILILIILVQILIGTIQSCSSIHTCLPSYIATGIHSYTATCIRKQRGTRNGTPQHSWSLLLSSPKKSLNIGVTACGHDIGELAIVGYLTAYCRTAGLQGCTATELQGYGATTLHRRLLATYRYPRCAQPRENHPSGHRWQSLLVRKYGRAILNGCLPSQFSHPMRW